MSEKRKTTGILIEGGSDITLTNNKFHNIDVPIDARNVTRLSATGNEAWDNRRRDEADGQHRDKPTGQRRNESVRRKVFTGWTPPKKQWHETAWGKITIGVAVAVIAAAVIGGATYAAKQLNWLPLQSQPDQQSTTSIQGTPSQ